MAIARPLQTAPEGSELHMVRRQFARVGGRGPEWRKAVAAIRDRDARATAVHLQPRRSPRGHRRDTALLRKQQIQIGRGGLSPHAPHGRRI